MTKFSFLLILAFLFRLPLASAQTLSVGDIAIIGANAVNPDEFAFVALVDIPQGTVIGFVDHGWLASGAFRTNEDELFYTATGTISKGTVVIIDTVGGAPRFSESGDQLLAFQGTIASPAFIYGLNFEGDGIWQSDATTSNTSALPTGLVNGSTAVAVAECTGNNHRYTGSTSGSKSDLLSEIGNKSNWTCSASRQSFANVFTVTDGGGNSFPEFVSPVLASSAVAGTEVQIQYTATDANSDPLSFGGIGLPVGSVIDTASGVFTWTPLENHVGTNTFTVTVSDGADTASISVTITVTSAIQARTPVFTVAPPDTLVNGSTSISLPFTVFDPEGLPISSYSVQPSNLDASIVNSAFVWTTSITPDIYRFTVTATDAEGLSVSRDLFVGVSGKLFDGEAGTALLESLQGAYTPAKTLGYDVARDTMYSKVDLDSDGFVRGIYTGFAVAYSSGDASTVMFNGGINAEHSWPQSMGAASEPQRGDMHFLFPAKDNVNSTRSNHPYAEIPDDQTQTWFMGASSQTTIPTSDIDTYSEYASGRFEPRESVKGDVAHAVFYFNTIYSQAANTSFFDGQKQTLVAWAATDVPSGKEIRRSGLIRKHQGNINPFLLDQSLAGRLFGTATHVENEPLPQRLQIETVYPSPTTGPFSVRVSTVSHTIATVSLYSVLGERLSVKSVVLPGGLIDLPVDLKDYTSGVYFVTVTSDKGSQTRSVLKY